MLILEEFPHFLNKLFRSHSNKPTTPTASPLEVKKGLIESNVPVNDATIYDNVQYKIEYL